jgi:hypothetical protein
LTLYEAMPEYGRTRYWKIRAMQNAKWGEWSEAVAFIAGTTEGPIDRLPVQRQSTSESTVKSAVPEGETKSPPVTGQVRANLPPSFQSGAAERPVHPQADPFAETVDGTTSAGRAFAVFSIMVISFLATLLMIATAIPT